MNENEPVDFELLEALGVMVESGYYPHRLRLLDSDGSEIARVTGTLVLGPDLVKEDGEDFAEIAIGEGELAAATLRISMDPATRCTVDPDGVMVGKLPSGASWVWEPDLEGSADGNEWSADEDE